MYVYIKREREDKRVKDRERETESEFAYLRAMCVDRDVSVRELERRAGGEGHSGGWRLIL